MLILVAMMAAHAQDLKFEAYTLPNGLEVILYEDHTLPQVVVNTWYKVGSKDEAHGRSGFAHLFEHLMFMGTNRLPANGIDMTMEANGGWNNAFTYQDATNYYDVGPANLLPMFLWIESDRMEQLGAAMTQEKLDLQRDVVRNERRQSIEDQPYASTELLTPVAMYPAGHPYAHSVIGSHADLEAASLQDVKDFFATWYVPNNAVLVIAGDFDPAAAKQLVDKSFGHVATRPVPERVVPAPFTGTLTASQVMLDRVEVPQLDLYWHTPAMYAAGDAELTLVANLLGQGESSRLYQRLVLGGLCQDVGVYQMGLLYDGNFAISATAMEGVAIEKIEAAVNDELQRLATTPPTAAEMERLHNQYETSTLAGLQSLQTRALTLAQYAAYTGEPGYLAKDLARFSAVDAAAVTASAKKFLVEGTVTKIIVEPKVEDAPTDGAANAGGGQ